MINIIVISTIIIVLSLIIVAIVKSIFKLLLGRPDYDKETLLRMRAENEKELQEIHDRASDTRNDLLKLQKIITQTPDEYIKGKIEEHENLNRAWEERKERNRQESLRILRDTIIKLKDKLSLNESDYANIENLSDIELTEMRGNLMKKWFSNSRKIDK